MRESGVKTEKPRSFCGRITNGLHTDWPCWKCPDTGIQIAVHGESDPPNANACVEKTLVEAYRQKGERFLKDIPGSFALALFDPDHKTALLARDKAGTVPLYYTEANGNLVFASSIKNILPYIDNPALHPQALLDYLTYFWALDEKTFLKDIFLIPQGGCWQNGTVTRYWQPEPVPETHSPQDWQEQIRQTLVYAVQSLQTDEDATASHLSGGIDSSVVSILMAQRRTLPLQAFCASFPDFPQFDETPYARLAAQKAAIHLNPVPIHTDDFARNFDDLVMTLEEPKCHPPVFARYMLERQSAGRNFRTIVTGRGADELFTGYDSHHAAQLENHQQRRTVFTAEERKQILRPAFLQEADYEPENTYRQLFARMPTRPGLERVLAFDWNTILMNWLVIDYKACNAFGARPSAPFLNDRLIDLALRIPVELKAPHDTPKHLLKQSVAPWLPQELLQRKKVGFRTPMGEMLNSNLREFVMKTLVLDDSIFWRWFEPAGVSSLIEQHFEKARNLGWQLWALLFIKRWACLFLEQGPWPK